MGDDTLSRESGLSLYKRILPELMAGRQVVLDFSEVPIVTPTFLNASIGYLLRDFDVKKLSGLVKVSHLQPQDLELLTRVVENAKIIYAESKNETSG